MHRSRLALAVSAACLAAAVSKAAAQGPATQAPAAQTRPAPMIDPEAKRVLRNAADYFAGIKAFRVTDRTTVNMIMDGAPKQRQSVATLAMERPDKFALRKEGPIGETVVCDGRNVYTYRPDSNRYSVEEVTAAYLEKLKDRIASRGIIGNPAVSILIADQPYEVFTRTFTRITYAGTEAVEGAACDRLRCNLSDGSHPFSINVDIWIRTGPQPLPLKVMPSFRGEGMPPLLKAAQMETVDILQDWWVGDDLPAETFHFQPPTGAGEVPRNQLTPPPPLNPMVGRMAPGATLELLGGGRIRLADHLDKHVVVLALCDPEYFMGSEYLPKVAALARDFQQEDVRFYVVVPAESRQAMQELLARTPLDIRVALDPKGRVARQYLDVPAIPMTVVIDRQGEVQVVQTNLGPKTVEQLRQQIRDVLDGKDLAADAIARERKKPSPQTQQAGTGRQEKPPAPIQGAKRIWSAAGWFQDVAASARTGEVYALAKGPKLVVLDRRGRQRRQVPLDGDPDRMRIGSLLPHGQPQIVLFKWNEPGLTAIDTAGKVLWRHDSGQRVNDVQLADLNGDGLDEIIIGSGGKPGLEVLDSQGQVLWTHPDLASGLAVGDLNGDGQPEIVTGWFGLRLRLLDARGKILRNVRTMPGVERIRLVPAGQQHPGLILAAGMADKKVFLAAISLDGQQRWAVDLPGMLIDSMAVAPTEGWAALGVMGLDTVVVVVDVATGQIISRIPDQGTRIAVMASAEGDPILLVASFKGVDAFSIVPVAGAAAAND